MSCDIFSSQNCKWGGALAPTIDTPPLPVSFRIDFKILTPSRSLRSSGTEQFQKPGPRDMERQLLVMLPAFGILCHRTF